MAQATETREKDRREVEKTSAKSAQAPQLSRQAGGTPFRLMRRFIDDMDRLFENFGFGPALSARALLPAIGEQEVWVPDIDMFERDGKLVVRADLPGLKKDDLRVEILEDQLVIQGERREEREEDREGLYRREVSYGTFYRSIPLPEGVNPDDANARFRDGVLEIELKIAEPRREEGKQVEVR